MTDWYYHDPARGRVGPHTADEIRARFRDRRIQPDTLLWHAGLREWQPLERLTVELDLVGVKPDTSVPPPLPPAMPRALHASSHAAHRHDARRTAPTQKGGLSGCAIMALVVAGLTVPAVGILAAIAIPAYRDYTVRAKTHSSVFGAAMAMQRAVDAYADQHGRCPGDEDMAPFRQRLSTSMPATVLHFGAVGDDQCAFEFTLGGIDRRTDGRTWVFVSQQGPDGPDWDCTGGDLPARFRPAVCRAE